MTHKLYQIDTTNATLSNPTFFSGVNNLEGLNDSILVTTESLNLNLINLKTNTVSTIGTVPQSASGDITWHNDNLFMSSGSQIIKIQINNTNNTLQQVSVINLQSSAFGFLGLASFGTANSNSTLVGFIGRDAYSICLKDGTVNLLCQSIIPNSPNGMPDGISGAASRRLPTSLAPLSYCNLPTGINNGFQKQRAEIYPNPVNKSGILSIKNLPENSSPLEIKIFNLQGKEIIAKTEIPNSTQLQLNLRDYSLTAGIYFLEITSSNQRSYSKIIVE